MLLKRNELLTGFVFYCRIRIKIQFLHQKIFKENAVELMTRSNRLCGVLIYCYEMAAHGTHNTTASIAMLRLSLN